MRMHPSREGKWPYLLSEGYEVVSIETWDYNCIAFAADVQIQWWWPDLYGDAEWPISWREETLDCFLEAFRSLGYKKCWFGFRVPRFEKIAIYAKNGVPTHAAKQL